MGEILLTKQEDELITRILRGGLGLRPGVTGYKWHALRFALARSLQIVEPPEEKYGGTPAPGEKGAELHLEQVTGEGKGDEHDFTDAYRLLLSTYHDTDLFADRETFIRHLQRHLRRGLAEIGRSWREGNDFHDYLYQEFYYSDVQADVQRDDRDVLSTLMARLGIRAAVRDVHHGPRLSRYILRLDSADDLDRLRRDLDKIPFELGYGDGITSATVPGERAVALDIPRLERDWWPVGWASVAEAVRAAKGVLPLCPGTDALGQPHIFDLADAPHLFVAGATGSGKSQCVHALIVSLLTAGRTVELALIDPKLVEFPRYALLGRRLWRGHGVAGDCAAAITLLEALVVEMEARQTELARMEVTDLGEAHARGSDLPRIVVVVDELADLILNGRDAVSDPLIRLAQKARAVGIHLILATQRPDAETFPGLLRANIPSRIALTVQKASDSRIILDETGAEKLLMRGDMLIKIAGSRTVRAHGARVTPGDISAVAK